jgi:hypothetical protein
MKKEEILKGLKESGMSFMYSKWHLLTEEQKKEIAISSLYVLENNDLLHNTSTCKNTLIDELEDIL